MPSLERIDNGKTISIICDIPVVFDDATDIEIRSDDWNTALTDGLLKFSWTKNVDIFEFRGETKGGRMFMEDVRITPSQPDELRLLDSDFFFLTELSIITPLRQALSELTVKLGVTSIELTY